MSTRACRTVGIDLGTTYSSLAYMDPHAQPRVRTDGNGQAAVPSVIFFDDEEVIVGEIALKNAKTRADRVVQFIKNQMGEDWRREIGGEVHTPESLSAIILAQLVREAEPEIGPIPSAVITVPAYFAEKHRQATQQAGTIAGLEVVGLLNEPMAAALAYGLSSEAKEHRVLVYDLGGGTFDVTIVRIAPGELEELATAGNRQLGGKDWDQCLIEHVADDFLHHHKIDPRGNAQVMQALQIECEGAKRQLGPRPRATVSVNAFGKSHEVEITRAKFEEMTAHLLGVTKLTVEMALEDARLTWNRITKVLLVGGSTHMPRVRQMLEDLSGSPPDRSVNPVTAVAMGAAVYAHMLESGKPPSTTSQPKPDSGSTWKQSLAPEGGSIPPTTTPYLMAIADRPNVRFITAHGVGLRLRSAEGLLVNRVLVPRNHPVPTSVSRRFLTHKQQQIANRLVIVVTQGDSSDPSLVEVLGTLELTGIPPEDPGGQPVDVTLRFDAQGRLHLSAVYCKTGQTLEQSLEIQGGLDDQDVRHFRDYLEELGMIRIRETTPRLLGSIVLEDEDLPLIEPI